MKKGAEASIQEAIRAYGMLQPGDRVLCALSGGADSVCMTHFLAGWGKRHGVTVDAAHFTHGLRPGAADDERALARQLCENLRIGFFTEEGDTGAFAAQNKMGTEEAARTLRYDFLRRTAKALGGAKIATAHNLGDQAETVLFHLIRGAGPVGLQGIPPVNGDVVRPLIFTPRDAVEDYLHRHGLDWAEDETNGQNIYARNRLRLEVLPLLEGINAQAARHIAEAGFSLGRQAGYFDSKAASLFEKGGLDVWGIVHAHPAVAGQAILSAYRASGLRGQLARPHIDAVIGVCKNGSPSAQISVPGGIARREYDLLYFETPGRRQVPARAFLALGERIRWGNWTVAALEGVHPDGWVLDRAAVILPIEVRSRRTGDQLLLGNHHKSVKKLMIEQKIPENMRDITPVLCDNNGVLGVAGIGYDSGRSRIFPEREAITILCQKGNATV